MRRPSAFLLIALGATPAFADGPSQSPIATDRPAVTDSSIVVPVGTLQVENGFSDTVSQGQRVIDGLETWLRLGVLPKTELRLIVPDYFGATTAGVSAGFGDLAVGVKQQLGPAPGGFDVSLIVAVSLPSGARGITSNGYDPFVQLPWSRALSPNWTAAGMLSVYWPTQDGVRNVTGETTFLFDRQLTKPWDTFVEYAGDFPQQGGPRHLLHVGAAYKIGLNQQIDFHFGVGLSSDAPDHFVAAGYSFRVQVSRPH